MNEIETKLKNFEKEVSDSVSCYKGDVVSVTLVVNFSFLRGINSKKHVEFVRKIEDIVSKHDLDILSFENHGKLKKKIKLVRKKEYINKLAKKVGIDDMG